MTEKFNPMRWLRAFARDPEASPRAKAVGCALLTYADPRGERAYPGVDNLCANTGLGSTAVKRGLADLRDLGWVEVVSRAHSGGRGGGSGRATTYRLRMRDTQAAPNQVGMGDAQAATNPWNEGRSAQESGTPSGVFGDAQESSNDPYSNDPCSNDPSSNDRAREDGDDRRSRT